MSLVINIWKGDNYGALGHERDTGPLEGQSSFTKPVTKIQQVADLTKCQIHQSIVNLEIFNNSSYYNNFQPLQKCKTVFSLLE